MKRIIMLLLALLLAVPAALGEESHLFRFSEGVYLRDLLSDGETLYIQAEDTLYTWKPGEAEMTAWKSAIRLPEPDGSDGERDLEFYELQLIDGEGKVRGLRTLWGEDGMTAMQLFDLAFNDDGTVGAGNAQTVDVPDILQDGMNYYISDACLHGGVLYMLLDGESDALCAVPLDAPSRATDESLPGWGFGLTASPDGPLLTYTDYDADALVVSRVDPDCGQEEAGRLPLNSRCLAADPATGAMFVINEGKACPADLDAGALGDAVAALPVDSNHGAVLAGGGLYAVDVGAGVAVLDANARLDEDSVLTICGWYTDDWMRTALMDYAIAHPEMTPTTNYELDYTQLLSDMLAQSGDVDVYLLDCSNSGAYQALLERGYLLPLGDKEAIADLTARLYPAFQKTVIRDGVPVAVPLSLYGSGMAVSETLLGKLGLDAGDVPQDWMGFIDYLENEIKPRLDALGEKEYFTYEGVTAESFHFFLQNRVMDNYLYCSSAAGVVPDYENPYLIQLLERIDAIDWTEYGLPRGDEGGDMGFGWSSDELYLIQFDHSFMLGERGDSGEGTPLALGFGDDLPGVLPVSMDVAVVNPYSAHAEAAADFLDYIARTLPIGKQYALCPDLNEPVRRDDADKVFEMYEGQIAKLREQVEEAEPADRQAMEESLSWWEKEYEDYKTRGLWLIPQEDLEWYRAHGDRLTVTVPSWFEKDESGEAWKLLEQYQAGQLSAREFLSAVNQKARMMALEG